MWVRIHIHGHLRRGTGPWVCFIQSSKHSVIESVREWVSERERGREREREREKREPARERESGCVCVWAHVMSHECLRQTPGKVFSVSYFARCKQAYGTIFPITQPSTRNRKPVSLTTAKSSINHTCHTSDTRPTNWQAREHAPRPWNQSYTLQNPNPKARYLTPGNVSGLPADFSARSLSWSFGSALPPLLAACPSACLVEILHDY